MEPGPERGLVATSRMRLGFLVAGAIIVLAMAGATVGVGMVQVHHVAGVLHKYQVYSDGAHIRLVAWRTSHGVYWVSNSLSRALSNRAMLGIARSLTRIPAR